MEEGSELNPPLTLNYSPKGPHIIDVRVLFISELTLHTPVSSQLVYSVLIESTLVIYTNPNLALSQQEHFRCSTWFNSVRPSVRPQ